MPQDKTNLMNKFLYLQMIGIGLQRLSLIQQQSHVGS